MKTKYTDIYGVQCREVKVLEQYLHGIRVQYKVKHGRTVFKCWIDWDMVYASSLITKLYVEFLEAQSGQ